MERNWAAVYGLPPTYLLGRCPLVARFPCGTVGHFAAEGQGQDASWGPPMLVTLPDSLIQCDGRPPYCSRLVRTVGRRCLVIGEDRCASITNRVSRDCRRPPHAMCGQPFCLPLWSAVGRTAEQSYLT